ncbi:DUF2837 family protein [Brevibacillus sp. SYP-B805]|uniref:lipid II flippase Amj family protein n=1 Tax=Brevibacillus sp. SYP-B805 TaxID=1578199 RepID=UPI0013EC3B65|nr:lipid II flippase Amj family protein [Brevibacillus sp. SYP-B805]NGQ95528.1 DUF2837 family protein [Brevibacillus sp. SYP-B805]
MMLILLFTFIIHMTETLSYAVRLAGVRTGKLAVALSLTGIILLISRTSNLFLAPLNGGLIGYAQRMHVDVEPQFRLMISAASLGTAAAILLMPTCVRLASRAIAHLEVAGSIPQLLKTSVTVSRIKQVSHHIRLPNRGMLSAFRLAGIPKRLLLLNGLVTAIYTIGVLSALYAALLYPEYREVAMNSSGLINGIATIIFTVLVDPQVALITDRTMKGGGDGDLLARMFVYLMLSRFAGTMLSQLLFLPAAHWIAWISPFFSVK